MAMVTLREFVATSLKDILKGIVEAQRDDEVGEYISKGDIGNLSFPADSGVVLEYRDIVTTVKFDIAVTVESRAEGGAGAGFGIGVVFARLGGDLAERSEGISRIQFAVPLVLPQSESTRVPE